MLKWIQDEKALGLEVEADRIRRHWTIPGRWRRRGKSATRQGLRFLLVVAVAAAVGIPPNAAADPQYSDWSTPVNMGSTVNSAALDQGPALSKDGLSLYITSPRSGGSGGNDIWVSQRDSKDDAWGTPVNLGSTVNTEALEGAPTFSRDGHWMFFNSDRSAGYGGLDIWASYRSDVHDDFDWEEPANLGSGVNTAFDDAGASYFANDDEADGGDVQLYFVSTRTGGSGFNDVYVATQAADGSFGSVVRVEELSSTGNDIRPSIRSDGLEMVFASNQSGGSGALDLWVSTRGSTTDDWDAPTNLGSGVNGAQGDSQPYLSSDRETLIFTSNRAGGSGAFDLWMTTRTKSSG